MVMWGGYVWVLYRVGEADTRQARKLLGLPCTPLAHPIKHVRKLHRQQTALPYLLLYANDQNKIYIKCIV